MNLITDKMLQAAASEAVERILATLPERQACGHVYSATFCQHMEECLTRTVPHRRIGRWMTTLVAAILLFFVLALSAGGAFREWVVELFSVEEVEQVPSPPPPNPLPEETGETAEILRYAVRDIGDVFDVEYLVSDKYLDTMGPLFYCTEDETTHFYEAADGAFVPVPSQRVQQQVNVQEITAVLDYTWCEYKGRVYFRQESECELTGPDGETYSIYLTLAEENIEVILYRGRQSDIWEYRVQLDPETGKITDFLKDITVKGKNLTDIPYLSSWEPATKDIWTVRMGWKPMEEESYLVDLNSKTAVSFRELCGLKQPVSGEKYVDGYFFLTVFDREAVTFDYYRYDPRDESCMQLYDNAVYWNGDTMKLEGDIVSFCGGRYHFLETGGKVYLVDEVTGIRMHVEGLTEKMADSGILDHATGERLLLSRFEEGGIGMLGILDVPSRILYLLEREHASDVREYAIGWHDGAVQIRGRDENWETFYIYQYRF